MLDKLQEFKGNIKIYRLLWVDYVWLNKKE